MYLVPKIGVTDIHDDVKKWMANLEFIHHEIDFFSTNLLGSYIFDPYTQDLFEKRSYLKNSFKEIRPRITNFMNSIRIHDNEMSGILECQENGECDLAYRTKHQEERYRLQEFLSNYTKLKAELFSYASEILRYRKK